MLIHGFLPPVKEYQPSFSTDILGAKYAIRSVSDVFRTSYYVNGHDAESIDNHPLL